MGTAYLVRSGKLDKLVELGKDKVDGLLGKKTLIEGINDSDFRKLRHAESLSDTLRNTNPLIKVEGGDKNCTACCIAAFLRRKGYDVTAKLVNEENKDLRVVGNKCIKNFRKQLIPGNAFKFGESRQAAADILLKRYGSNAEGVVSVIFKGGGGHAFNWVINDGVVKFFCAQRNLDDEALSKIIWSRIATNGELNIVRLDNAEFNMEALKEFIE